MKNLRILLVTIIFSQIKQKFHFITLKLGDFRQNLAIQVLQIIQSKIFENYNFISFVGAFMIKSDHGSFKIPDEKQFKKLTELIDTFYNY